MKFKIVSKSYELSTPCQKALYTPILMSLVSFLRLM
jgi:hypothetical protein